MPQLFGVPHHIYSGDFFVLDFERGRLKFTIGLQGQEAGQSVDESGTNKFRPILPELSRQAKPRIGRMAAGRLPSPSA